VSRLARPFSHPREGGCGRGCDRLRTERGHLPKGGGYVRWTDIRRFGVLCSCYTVAWARGRTGSTAASVAEAIEAAGLGWSVVKKPLVIDRGPDWQLDVLRYKRVHGYYATVRQDTEDELGVVGSAIASCRIMKHSRSSSALGQRIPFRDCRESARRQAGVGARHAPRSH